MNYARNLWYVAAWDYDLKPNIPVGLAILGEPIVIWRNSTGILTALENRCVHRLAPLSLGRCEGENLRCMYHGIVYDRSGAVVEIPGQDQIPQLAKVRAYPIVERHSWIWIWMGDPLAADDALIPPAVGLDDPDYILGSGQLDYAAEARLINDNLLDFSHLSYVHANSFRSTEQFARERPNVTSLPQGVRVERWVTGRPIASIRSTPPELRFDRYQRYEFLLPGVLLMTGGVFPQGTAKRLEGEAPDLSQALDGVTFTSQAVTPMTEKTSRYFFSWGPHVKHGDAGLRDTLMGIAGKAFTEDRTIIEAQQLVIDITPNPRVMPTTADRAVTIFNQILAKRLRIEYDSAPQLSADAAHASGATNRQTSSGNIFPEAMRQGVHDE
jgi:phenylpropionate dioxygenase-like ring-hydroxylating dioxygenase large terminal subunit